MKKYITTLIIATSLLCACEKGQETATNNQQDNIVLTGAEISSRVENDGDDTTTSNTLFTEGDIVTVVGAANENVSFLYLGENTWRVDRPYQWKDNPTMVYAYYKSGVAVVDGEQIPEFFVAAQDCTTTKELSFTDNNSFKHATALVRVEIKNWSSNLAPQSVELKDLHKITYITSGGEYQVGDDLCSIKMELVAENGTNYTYEARVPAGDATTPNIESGYKLFVDDINVLEWEVDESKIASFYEINKVYTYTLNYTN